MAVLHEIKEFRKGIHGLEWDNLRLDLEEEDLLQAWPACYALLPYI